ncbi:MAG: F0F1 ATP synthase subunit epsilon [Pseudomonadota bacterium]
MSSDDSKKLFLTLVYPEGQAFEGEVHSVTLPTVEGQITVLPGHTSLLTTLVKGKGYYKWIDDEGKEMKDHYEMGDGFVEVSDNKVVVLAEFIAKSVLVRS